MIRAISLGGLLQTPPGVEADEVARVTEVAVAEGSVLVAHVPVGTAWEDMRMLVEYLEQAFRCKVVALPENITLEFVRPPLTEAQVEPPPALPALAQCGMYALCDGQTVFCTLKADHLGPHVARVGLPEMDERQS